MPRSKRSKLVSLTKVEKKNEGAQGGFDEGSASKKTLKNGSTAGYSKLGLCAIHISKLSASYGKSITARIFFGRSAVMAKALGATPEEEHRMGISKLAKQIQGQVGLFFTDSEPDEVIEWFADFQQPDFARAGNVAVKTVVLPAGPVMRTYSDPPEPFPHNEEPQLRKLGLSTYMNKGVPSLHNPHTLCEKGKKLTSEQAQLLKLIGEKMVTFRVSLTCRWEAATGDVVQIEGQPLPDNSGEAEVSDDDEMDE
ncbi:Ribosome assembly factor mrt4 [Mycena indigotica]|uniref:Ribosome assembly factor mrt4 n=1 Tax=Mycena indigotica TaxID=2126181 RepID=A0A8H6SZ23_9AGAR|nr:Ribosome assembly factor mrt4 [Mycena indigotica]KAF7306520.1 Ribosome assembly factor mrt4 [Mycena indigotica]